MNHPFVERIRKGLTVWSSDRRKLGKVVAVRANTFDVEKGLFFPKDYMLPFDFVRDVQGEKVILSRSGERRALLENGPYRELGAAHLP